MGSKKIALLTLVGSLLLPGCAQVRMGYHYLNYKGGNYLDSVDDHRIKMSDERRSLEKEILSKAKIEIIGEGDDQVYVLYAQGTPYEVGFQHGRLLKEQVRENVGRVNHLGGVLKASLEKDINELESQIKNEETEKLKEKLAEKKKDLHNLKHGYELLEPNISESFKEEMKGLADGAGLSLESVQYLQAVGDIAESHCSNYVLGANATEQKEMIQVRILDFPLALKVQNNPLISVIKPNEGHAFATIGWAGFLGAVTGISSEKIALGEMRGDNAIKAYRTKNNLETKQETLQGIPMPFLLRDILQFDTDLEEATNRLRFAERTNCYVYVIGDGEAQNSKAYLTDRELFRVYTSEDFQTLLSSVEPETEFQGHEGVIFGGHNNSMINNQVTENYGRITEDLIKQEFNPALAMKDNLQIAIYNLTKMTIQVANAEGDKGKACNQNYVFLNLNEAFGWFKK